MEEQKGIALLTIIGSLFIIFLVVLFVVFIISQKRKQHSLKTIIEIMKASHSKNYDELKQEISELKEEISEMKSSQKQD